MVSTNPQNICLLIYRCFIDTSHSFMHTDIYLPHHWYYSKTIPSFWEGICVLRYFVLSTFITYHLTATLGTELKAVTISKARRRDKLKSRRSAQEMCLIIWLGQFYHELKGNILVITSAVAIMLQRLNAFIASLHCSYDLSKLGLHIPW